MEKPLDFNNPLHSDALWLEALNFVKVRMDQATFNLWLEPLKPSALQDDALVVEAPDSFSSNWVQSHYGAEIIAARQSLNPAVNRVVFVAKEAGAKSEQDEVRRVGSAQGGEPKKTN